MLDLWRYWLTKPTLQSFGRHVPTSSSVTTPGRCALMRGVLVAGLLLSPAVAIQAADWWNQAWQYRQHVTIDATSVTEDLVDFPLRLRFSDAEFARRAAQVGGKDLRAVGSNGQPLKLEIVHWDRDDVSFYVHLPVIKASAVEQGFHLYLGNPEASAESGSGAWNDEHLAVLHVAGDVSDATGRTAAALKQGFVVQNGWTAGLILGHDPARWITLNNEAWTKEGYLKLDPATVPSAGSSLTFVCRFRARPTPDSSHALISGTEFDIAIQGTTVVFRAHGSELSVEGIRAGEWQSGVFTYNQETREKTICIDGRTVATATGATQLPLTPGALRIGRGVSDESRTQFSGDIEGIRLLGTAKSRAWIRAIALNLSDANDLVKIGAVERADGSLATLPPELLRPFDGTHSHKPAGIELEWLPSVGAVGYEVLLFKDARGGQLLKRIDAGSARKYALTPDQAEASEIYWTIAAKSEHGEACASQLHRLRFRQNDKPDAALSPAVAVAPLLSPATNIEINLQGYLRGRMDRLAQYMIDFTGRSPGLMRMQRERPEKDVAPWAGVYTGQYLSSAQLMWRVTRNPELKVHIDAYVRELIATQRADGYLGPFENITGFMELWNHYGTLCGLLDYHEDTGYRPALDAARKVADLVIQAYGPAGGILPKWGGYGQSITHTIARLARVTQDPRYLEMASYLIHEAWNEPGGVAFHHLGQGHPSIGDFPVRRWEGVPGIMALSEMYWLSGDASYKSAFENLWETLRRTERHITGGFSTNEGLLGTTFIKGSIETCCTVAWSLLSTDMLRLTADSRVADELEWSTINSALGSIPYDGTCSTYGTQPDGVRKFCELMQGPPDGTALSCCSTNAPRALGNIANWALMKNKDGLLLNFYGPSKIAADLQSGNRVSLEQTTQYPAQGDIRLGVTVEKPEAFTLHLRIPEWSKQTRVTLNGKALPAPPAGSYLPIRRLWKSGDTIALSLDFMPRFQTGEKDFAGKVAVFRGPILFSSDERYDADRKKNSVPLALDGLKIEPIEPPAGEGPWILARMTDGRGRQSTVCDFSSAGIFGDTYVSWFDLENPTPSR